MQNDLPPDLAQQPHLERRLATILMADVAGYSRMMGKDEERTVQMLRGHREVFDALLAAHRGRIFNTAGDAILAEFPSAVEAVRCATEIQSALRTRNEKFPEEERMWFRIGINLGDVIVQGADLLGDGVNVAARIQTIAEPGGVCISGSVYDQIQNKLTLQFRQLGERSFKNIAQPIRTFSIAEANGAAMPVSPAPARTTGTRHRRIVAGVGLCILVLAAGFGSWLYRDHQARRAEERQRAAVMAQQAAESKRLAAAAEQARAEKQRLELERAAAEEAQRREREARLAAEAQAAREAMARAEMEKQHLDQALQRAAKEQQAAAPATPAATTPQQAAPAEPAQALSPYDGSYPGQLCNERTARQPERRCWPVVLQVEQGRITAAWEVLRLGKTGRAQGTIADNGAVALALDGWTQNGAPTSASLTGTCDRNRISASGRWQGGRPVTGEWQRGQPSTP